MSNIMLFAEGMLSKKQVIDEFGIPETLQADLFAILKPRVGKLYWKMDVDPALAKVFGGVGRPPFANDESSFEKEALKVNAITQAVEPFERIAQGIERLIDLFEPRTDERENATIAMLTTAEAAKKMGLNVQTVREWCRDGKLGVRTGSRWLISPDEVKQYLRGQLLIKGKVAG
jgi:excisionase family DNA binding protein